MSYNIGYTPYYVLQGGTQYRIFTSVLSTLYPDFQANSPHMKLILLPAILLITFSGIAQSNFSSTNFRIGQSTYTDISSTGTAITMTNNESGVSTAAHNIGFNFQFNDSVFTQFRIHADGILRLGTEAPAAATNISVSPANSHAAVFTSTLDSFQYVILPFFTNLVASGSPAFHVQTSGVAPNRVCTIQWKNLQDADNANGAVLHQFSQLEFQVKLYEGSNDIEFVYGNFTPSASTLSSRNAAVGIKATSNSFAANYKGINNLPFSAIVCFNQRNNARLSNGIVFRRDAPPSVGFSQRYYGKIANDVAVVNVYADSMSPITSQSGNRIEAMIKNEGSNTANDIVVNLQITGANTHSANVNIASLAAGESQLVSFPAFATSNKGTQQIQVSVTAAADDRAANNSITATQKASSGHVQLPNLFNSPFGVGFNGGTGLLATKVYGTGTRKIRQIRIPFSTYRNIVNVRVYEDGGTNGTPSSSPLMTSNNFFTTNENSIILSFGNTANTVTGDYYIAVQQTSTANMGWRSTAAPPIRTNRLFSSSLGTSWAAQADSLPWQQLLEVYEETAGPDVGIEYLAAPGCNYSNATDVTVTLRNFSSSDIDFATTPATISGTVRNPQLTEFPFTITKNTGTLAAGASETITVLSNYDYTQRGYHFVNAKTTLPGDVENGNDSLRFFLGNHVPVTRSISDSVCPLTAVTLTGPSYLANLQWNLNGTPSTGTTLTLSPTKTTTVYVQGTDYRGCLLQDSVVVLVKKEYGAAPKPVILFGDTLLSHRNEFKDTLRVAKLSGHSIRWLGGLGTVSADSALLLTQVVGLQNAKVSVAYIRDSDGCGTLSDTLTYKYATGLLHNSNNTHEVCDTSYYDAGGATSITGNSFTKIFTPATPGKKVKLRIYFTDLANFASIMVHDGNSTSSPRIVAVDNTKNGSTVLEYIASNETGALTVQFNRGSFASTGWFAGLTCHSPEVYRTVQNGLWTDATTWEKKTPGGNYMPATRAPLKGDDSIYVRHEVLLNVSVQTDQLIIEPSGHLRFESPTSSFISMNVFQTTAQPPIEVRGKLSTNASTQIFGSDKMIVTGELAHEGKIDLDSVMMVGTSTQILGKSGGASGIMKLLHMNNAAGVQVAGTQVVQRIRFVQGLLNTSAQAYISIEGTAINARDASHINGPAGVAIMGAGDRFYPIGTNGQYRPVIISNSNASSFDNRETILVEPKTGAPAARTLPAGISNISQVRYYRITCIDNIGSDYQVTIPYGTDDGVSDPANLTIVKDDGGSAWIDIGGTATGAAPGSITSNTFNGFSDFVFANKTGGTNTLPVTWKSFTATAVQKDVVLQWQTSNEVDCKNYSIERSSNGQQFVAIGQMLCNNNSSSQYQYTDKQPGQGTWYYRIRQQDVDGSFTYTAVRKVNLQQSATIKLYPNPANAFVQITGLTGFEKISLTDASGRVVFAQNVSGTTIQIPVAQLSVGQYNVQIQGKDHIETQKIMIVR